MKPAFLDPITGWCISSFAPRSPSKSETLCVRQTPWGPCPEVTAGHRLPSFARFPLLPQPSPVSRPTRLGGGARVGPGSRAGRRVHSVALTVLWRPLLPPEPALNPGLGGGGGGDVVGSAAHSALSYSHSLASPPEPAMTAPTPRGTHPLLQPSHSRLSPSTGDGSPPGTTPRNRASWVTRAPVRILSASREYVSLLNS